VLILKNQKPIKMVLQCEKNMGAKCENKANKVAKYSMCGVNEIAAQTSWCSCIECCSETQYKNQGWCQCNECKMAETSWCSCNKCTINDTDWCQCPDCVPTAENLDLVLKNDFCSCPECVENGQNSERVDYNGVNLLTGGFAGGAGEVARGRVKLAVSQPAGPRPVA